MPRLRVRHAPYAVLAFAVGCALSSQSLFVGPARHQRQVSLFSRAAPAEGEPQIVTIEMKEPLDGRIGIAIQSGRRTVSSLSHKDAFATGWRVGDVIVEVNGAPVADNDAVKAAVKNALESHRSSREPLRFVVKRRPMQADTSRGMVRMTPGTGGSLTVPMLDLIRSLLAETTAVLFLDGTMRTPNNNLSARAVEALTQAGIAFKGIDCSDEKYNPGVRQAVEELVGEASLPQLFAGGRPLGNGYKIQELQESGQLLQLLSDYGAVKVEA